MYVRGYFVNVFFIIGCGKKKKKLIKINLENN